MRSSKGDNNKTGRESKSSDGDSKIPPREASEENDEGNNKIEKEDKSQVSKDKLAIAVGVDRDENVISTDKKGGGESETDDNVPTVDTSTLVDGIKEDNNMQSAKTSQSKSETNTASVSSATIKKSTARKVNKYPNWPLRDIKEPEGNDVLYGRGGGTNHHDGNKRYRKMVDDRKVDYVKSKRLDKPLVALEIIKEWRAQEPPGRFLKLDESSGLWFDVGDRKAREKTSQALREKAPQLRKQQMELETEAGGGGNDSSNRNVVKANKPESRSSKGKKDGEKSRPAVVGRGHSLGFNNTNEPIDIGNFSWDTHVTQDDPVVPSLQPSGPMPAYAIRGSGSSGGSVCSSNTNSLSATGYQPLPSPPPQSTTKSSEREDPLSMNPLLPPKVSSPSRISQGVGSYKRDWMTTSPHGPEHSPVRWSGVEGSEGIVSAMTYPPSHEVRHYTTDGSNNDPSQYNNNDVNHNIHANLADESSLYNPGTRAQSGVEDDGIGGGRDCFASVQSDDYTRFAHIVGKEDSNSYYHSSTPAPSMREAPHPWANYRNNYGPPPHQHQHQHHRGHSDGGGEIYPHSLQKELQAGGSWEDHSRGTADDIHRHYHHSQDRHSRDGSSRGRVGMDYDSTNINAASLHSIEQQQRGSPSKYYRNSSPSSMGDSRCYSRGRSDIDSDHHHHPLPSSPRQHDYLESHSLSDPSRTKYGRIGGGESSSESYNVPPSNYPKHHMMTPTRMESPMQTKLSPSNDRAYRDTIITRACDGGGGSGKSTHRKRISARDGSAEHPQTLLPYEQRRKYHPPAPPHRTNHTSKNSQQNNLLQKPQPVKRETSHQNENEETKRMVKRSFYSSGNTTEPISRGRLSRGSSLGEVSENDMKTLESSFEQSNLGVSSSGIKSDVSGVDISPSSYGLDESFDLLQSGKPNKLSERDRIRSADHPMHHLDLDYEEKTSSVDKTDFIIEPSKTSDNVLGEIKDSTLPKRRSPPKPSSLLESGRVSTIEAFESLIVNSSSLYDVSRLSDLGVVDLLDGDGVDNPEKVHSEAV